MWKLVAGILGLWMVLYVISMAVVWIGAVYVLVEGILFPLAGLFLGLILLFLGVILFAGAKYVCQEFWKNRAKADPGHMLAAWSALGMTALIVAWCVFSYKTDFRLTKWLVFDGGPDWRRIITRSFFIGVAAFMLVYILIRGVFGSAKGSASQTPP